jgi:DNA polymerase
MTAWFAGESGLLALFASKADPYKHMAARIYGKDPKVITKDERFMGKQAVLGCGYGMGWEKFQRMLDEVYDVSISTELAMRVVQTYRETNSRICALWRRLEQGFTYALAMKKERLQVLPGVSMGNLMVGATPYAWIELPSGRRLYYCEPELTDGGIQYWGRNIYTGGKWERVGTWGGKITENIVQATSRDLMADAMLRLEAEGFSLVLTVHDEIVADAPMLPEKFKAVMLTLPTWAAGLPVDAEVFQAARYRK